MASIFKPTYTRKDPKTGKSVKRKLRKWYVKYRDAEGIIRKVPGYTDKAATLQLATQLERDAELGKIGIVNPFEKHRKQRLREHLKGFEQHLRDKGDSEHHVYQTATRARTVVEACEFTFIDDIAPSGVEAFLRDLRDRGRSIETSNHYLRAVKQFCRWMVLDRRTGDNPLAHLKKLNVDMDRRHDRRPLSPEEFAALIESAAAGPMVQNVPGAERAMLYILAAWTGFRRKELSSLTLRSFDLESEFPTLQVKAGFSKRRKADTIPLHPVVVQRLREWLDTKGEIDPDEPLFALRTPGGYLRRTSRMMRLDLERAGIPYQDEEGLYADFHSNRHTFISNLSKVGVSPKMAQTLARHSDMNLTMNVYTHVGLDDQSLALANLPAPPKINGAPCPDEPRATAADDVHVQKHVHTTALNCPELTSGGTERVLEGEGLVGGESHLSDTADSICHPLAPCVAIACGVGEELEQLPPEPKVASSNLAGDTRLTTILAFRCTQVRFGIPACCLGVGARNSFSTAARAKSLLPRRSPRAREHQGEHRRDERSR